MRVLANPKVSSFFSQLRGKRVAICGLGRNNIPVVRQFLKYGAVVTGYDRKDRRALGAAADELESAGVSLCLGEGYLDALLERGADLIIRTPGFNPNQPQLEQARRKGIPVTSEMELFFELCPAEITAVSGSDGKTTTTTIIAGLLEAAGYMVHLGGNIGRPLLPIIQEIGAGDKVVVELSSFQLCDMRQSPDVAVITNISPNHLDWHSDMQDYINAKKNLIIWQDTGGTAVLNADNQHTQSLSGLVRGELLTFSRRERPKRGAWLTPDGFLTAVFDGVDTPVLHASEIRIPGTHNIENYLAAIAAVWGKVPQKTIADYARSFSGVAHRCEFVRELDGVKWYNDSIGTSPSRTIAGLNSFDRRVILIAGGYDKHIPYDALGQTAARTVKRAILMGQTAGAIKKEIQKYSDIPIDRVKDMEEAVITAKKIAKAGDIVFMSPASASFDMYENFEERGNHFKQLVMKL